MYMLRAKRPADGADTAVDTVSVFRSLLCSVSWNEQSVNLLGMLLVENDAWHLHLGVLLEILMCASEWACFRIYMQHYFQREYIIFPVQK